jgi:biopolymer transport protein TolQ
MIFGFPAVSVPLYAFQQSDAFGQGIVIFLFCISAYLWSVMVEKGLALKKARQANKKFRNKFDHATSILDVAIAKPIDCPLNNVYVSGVTKLMYLCDATPETAEQYCRQRKLPKTMTPMELEIVVNTADHTVSSESLLLEEKIGNLATIVGASPFFGLLGTVWGVMAAFCGMAQQNSADINALAPGVSGALLTTVVGLLVAIPSLIGYNMLTNMIQKMNVEMDTFVNDFESRLKTEASVKS